MGIGQGLSPLSLGESRRIKAKPLKAADARHTQQRRVLNDAAIERIPQQILGLGDQIRGL